ncbi:MAG: 50S ribosomal protein L31 [Mycoplasmataceae bacterium]|jgi:large subunit ribosomal protein L31|nr:50S ribosomal protein L31 [Mycoplasmataceae bacterium]
MNKKIQPKSHLVKFECATCGTTFELLSTVKQDTVGIDVCSNCHPLYKTGASEQKVKGRAEKLAAKFDAGLKNASDKKISKQAPKKVSTKAKKSKQLSLDELN